MSSIRFTAEGSQCDLSFESCNVKDLAAYTALMISETYQMLQIQVPKAADDYKRLVVASVAGEPPVAFQPVEGHRVCEAYALDTEAIKKQIAEEESTGNGAENERN